LSSRSLGCTSRGHCRIGTFTPRRIGSGDDIADALGVALRVV
jgi:hypothetical protein